MEIIKLTMKSVMHYGKHEGRQIEGIFDYDPEYLKMLHDVAGEQFDDEVIAKIKELWITNIDTEAKSSISINIDLVLALWSPASSQ